MISFMVLLFFNAFGTKDSGGLVYLIEIVALFMPKFFTSDGNNRKTPLDV